ncbi:hypothetical protein HYE24_03800 [Mycoplasmopsis bovis]|nr:hypothetical protein [Mycoplasmopsis bovis]QQH23767.1 hypothetical protein HYE24_03800 [Mycoplasmopsis bovis]
MLYKSINKYQKWDEFILKIKAKHNIRLLLFLVNIIYRTILHLSNVRLDNLLMLELSNRFRFMQIYYDFRLKNVTIVDDDLD